MRIQTYQRQQGQPTTTGTAKLQGMGTAEAGTATALNTLQKATNELAERSAEALRQTEVMTRTYGMRKAYGEWFTQRAADPSGFATLHAESQDMLNKLGTQVLEGVEDPLAQAAIVREVMQYSAEQSPVALRTAVQQQTDWSRGALEEQLWLRRQEVASALPHEKGRLVAQTRDMLNAAAGAGYISPLDAEKRLRGFVDGVAEDELMLDVYRDPNGVLERMASGEFNAMSTDSRQRIILNAERRAEALREERESDRKSASAEDKRIRKEIQDQNFGTFYDAATRGQIPRTALKEALDAGEIRGEQYRTLVDAWDTMAAAGGPGNDEMMSQMRYRAFRGELSVGEVLQATTRPDGINDAQRNELVGMLKNGGAATQTEAYRVASAFLESQLGIAQGFEGLSKQDLAVAGLAQQELYERVTAAQDEKQAMQVAREIAERFNKSGGMPLVMAPAPRFKTKGEALRAWKTGRISRNELLQELYMHRRRDEAGVTPEAGATP